MDNTNNFETAFTNFLATAQAIVDEHMTRHFPNLPRPVLSAEPGRRYVRVVKSDGESSRHVYCFIDRTNGDILKSESWKKPAKHARGNIYTTTDMRAAVNEYGAHYLSR